MPRALPLLRLGIVALFCASSTAQAESCRTDLLDARVGMIDMDGAARTEAVSSREALGLVDQAGGLNFRRTVDEFWRVKVERSVDPLDLIVRYQVEGGDDRSGDASHREVTGQKFPVRLIPIQPRVLCENSTHRIIAGGFTALARASGIGMAGLYSLEIEVDVQER